MYRRTQLGFPEVPDGPLDPPDDPDWDVMAEEYNKILGAEVELGEEIYPTAQDGVTQCIDAIWDTLTPGAKDAADRVLYAVVMGAEPNRSDVARCQSLVWGELVRIVQLEES